MIKKLFIFLLIVVLLLLISAGLGVYFWKPIAQYALSVISDGQCAHLQLDTPDIKNFSTAPVIQLDKLSLECLDTQVQLESINFQGTWNLSENLGQIRIGKLELKPGSSSASSSDSISTELPDIPELLKSLPRFNVSIDKLAVAYQGKSYAASVKAMSSGDSLNILATLTTPYPVELRAITTGHDIALNMTAEHKDQTWLKASSLWSGEKARLESDIHIQTGQMPEAAMALLKNYLPAELPLPQGVIRIDNELDIPKTVDTRASKIMEQIRTSGQLQLDIKGQYDHIPYHHRGHYDYHFAKSALQLSSVKGGKPYFRIQNPTPEINSIAVKGSKIRFNYQLNRDYVELQADTSEIVVAGDINQSINVSALNLSGKLSDLWLSSALSGTVDLPKLGNSPISGQLKLNISNANRLKGTLSGTVETLALPFTTDIDYSLGQSKGKARTVVTQWSLAGLDFYSLIEDESVPLALSAGTASLHNTVNMDGASLHHSSVLKLESLAGDYDGLPFNGLNIDTELDGNLKEISSRQSILALQEINLGFPINQTRAELAWEWDFSALPNVQLNSLSALMLGGDVKAAPSHIDLNKSDQALNFSLNTLDLGQVLALAGQEGLSATGHLSGALPVRLSPDGISISQAKIGNISLGSISYKPTSQKRAALASAGPHMEILMNVLAQLDYDLIDINLAYQKNGDTELEVHIEGQNPDYQNGQRVNFNPRFEINVPNMLTSLQLVNNISDKIQRQVQKRYLDKQE